MIKENWTFYTDWLKSKLPVYFNLLNPGADKKEVEKLESYLGFSLPENVKALYELNNGDNLRNTDNLYVGAFLGFEFLSVDRVMQIHSGWKKQDNEGFSGSSFPKNHIRIQYTNPKWIPLFSDAASNYVGVDLDPAADGTPGQIINFGRDEDHKFVIAKDLDSFLGFIGQKIRSGQCDKAIVVEDDGGYSYGLSPQSHLIDDLRCYTESKTALLEPRKIKSTMQKKEIEKFYPKTRQQWRKWLEGNHQRKEAVWLIFYKKRSGKPTLTWSDAVDEALCFGWIDSVKRTLDEESSIQFFSRRKPQSTWSAINKEKIKRLSKDGLMAPAGLHSVKLAKKNGSWTLLDTVEKLIIPEDLDKAFTKHKGSKQFFESLGKTDKKMLLQWLVLAKTDATRNKRIAEIAENAAQNQKPAAFRPKNKTTP